jgi:hypothetical protein
MNTPEPRLDPDPWEGCWEEGVQGIGDTPRQFYAWYEEDIPRGAALHHLCGNRHCLNPRHMRLVAPKERRL